MIATPERRPAVPPTNAISVSWEISAGGAGRTARGGGGGRRGGVDPGRLWVGRPAAAAPDLLAGPVQHQALCVRSAAVQTEDVQASAVSGLHAASSIGRARHILRPERFTA